MGADRAGLAMSALVVCGTAIRDRIQLQVKEHDSEWCELRGYGALLGDPSTMKSPIIKKAFAPIARIDGKLRRDYAAKRAKYDALPTKEKKHGAAAAEFPSLRRHDDRKRARGFEGQHRRRYLRAG